MSEAVKSKEAMTLQLTGDQRTGADTQNSAEPQEHPRAG